MSAAMWSMELESDFFPYSDRCNSLLHLVKSPAFLVSFALQKQKIINIYWLYIIFVQVVLTQILFSIFKYSPPPTNVNSC